MLEGFINAIASDIQTQIATVLPAAAGIVGAILAVSLGYKLFKRVTGR